MAQSNKLQYTEIIEKDFFKNPKESAEEFNIALLDLAEGFKVVQKEATAFLKVNKDPKTAEELKKVNAEIDKSVKSRQALSIIEKQLLAVQKQNEALQKKVIALENAKKKATEDSTKATKVKTDAEKAEAQLQAKASRDRVKQLQAEAILENEKAGREDKINAQLTILRLNRAKLTGAESDYLEQVEKINKAIDEQNELLNSLSDKQKKAKANVGNYTESVREAIDSSQTFKDILGGVNNQSGVFINATRGVVNQLKKIREGFQQAETKGGKFKAVLKGGIFGAVAIAGGLVAGAAATYRDVADEIELRTAQIGNVLVAFFMEFSRLFKDVLAPTIQNVFLKIERATTIKALNPDEWNKLNDAIIENEKSINSYSFSFEDFLAKFKDSNKLLEEQLALQKQLADTTNIYQREISILNSKIEVQTEIAGDSTRSFLVMNKANEQALKLTEQKIAKEVELARITKDAVVLEVQRAFLGRNKTVSKNEIETLSFIKNENTAKVIGLELQQKLTDALVSYNEKQGQFSVAQIKSEREKRQINQDIFEQDLDILIDGFDNQKTINERKIADEKRVFEERRKVLEDTRVLGVNSYEAQKQLFDDLVKFELKMLDEKIKKETNLKAKLKLQEEKDNLSKKINIDELVATEDAVLLNKKIKALKLSEIVNNRILEIVRERKTVVQDLTDAEKELNLAEKEKNQRIKESQQAIVDARFNLEIDLLDRQTKFEEQIQDSKVIKDLDRLKDLEEERVKLQKAQIEIESKREEEIAKNTITNTDEKTAKLLEIEALKNEKLIKLERDKNDKIKQLNKEQFNNYVQEGNKAVQTLLDSYNQFSDKRDAKEQASLDRQIDKRQTNIERQTDLASRGLQNQLAFEEQQLAKAELKRQQLAEEQARKQEIIDLTKTYFNFLNAELQKPNANTGTAIFNALGLTATSKGVAKTAVGSFFEGTENVERDLQGNKVHNGVDGYQIRVHGKERVMDEIDNMKTGYMSNEDLANLAYDYRMGNLLPLSQINEASNNIQKGTAQNIYNSLLLQQQAKTNQLLEELVSKPVQQVHVDSFSNLVETIQSNTEKVVITHKTNLRPRIK